jgi:hypothetical protein
MFIPEDSPLRRPPSDYSRRQVLVLDGIRYSAEMAHIAYERLFASVNAISSSTSEPLVRDTATALLDAWSIVDSAHRCRDLVANLPGLPNSSWRRLLMERTQDAADLRDCVQHQLGEIDGLIAGGGQVWGYVSWAEVRDGRHTGKWLMLVGGSEYVGDKFFFIGPAELPYSVPAGRIRLNAFGRQVYLGRTVHCLAEAVEHLCGDIRSGAMRAIGSPATERRGADSVMEGALEVLVSRSPSNPETA